MEDLRVNYNKFTLTEDTVESDPISQFKKWFDQAVEAEILEPNACILSTVSEDQPDSRTILLKGVDEEGFAFYTSYGSVKGNALKTNPKCSLLFLYLEQHRQVRIRGSVVQLTEKESEAYFLSRPFESQLGAWASEQSRDIKDRTSLEAQLNHVRTRFSTEKMYKPPYWGGYKIIPNEIEFWQGRENRLHDRILYTNTNSGWKIGRIQP